jgi:hypothetical protein
VMAALTWLALAPSSWAMTSAMFMGSLAFGKGKNEVSC